MVGGGVSKVKLLASWILAYVQQFDIGTCLQHLVRAHEFAGVGIIRDDQTIEAPFVTQQLLNQGIAAACPCSTNAVERGHHGLGDRRLDGRVLICAIGVLLNILHVHVAGLHAGFEGLQVQLADRLFV